MSNMIATVGVVVACIFIAACLITMYLMKED
jgi:hypothetical protein